MNQPDTGSPHPSETSGVTLAIDQLTPGVSKPAPADHVREKGRSSGESRYFYPTCTSDFEPVRTPSCERQNTSFVASKPPATPPFRAIPSPAGVRVNVHATSHASVPSRTQPCWWCRVAVHATGHAIFFEPYPVLLKCGIAAQATSHASVPGTTQHSWGSVAVHTHLFGR